MFDDYIFVRPSFVRGAARAIDIGGSLGHESFVLSRTPREADARALASDFRAVNRDLNAALDELESSGAGADGQE